MNFVNNSSRDTCLNIQYNEWAYKPTYLPRRNNFNQIWSSLVWRWVKKSKCKMKWQERGRLSWQVEFIWKCCSYFSGKFIKVYLIMPFVIELCPGHSLSNYLEQEQFGLRLFSILFSEWLNICILEKICLFILPDHLVQYTFASSPA